MSDIQPFKGIRPKQDLVQKIASPPYDVMNSKEAKKLTEQNPYSYLRVVKAEVNFDSDIDPHSEEVYQKSAETLQNFIRDGILIQDSSPCFYIYEITMGSHTQRGLMFGASLEEYETGLIKKHEFTIREKEDDRAHHVEVLNANTGPVMLSYHADKNIDDHFERICAATEPTYNFTADDGIKHVMWVISDPEDVKGIQEDFRNLEAMYIADGHHRSAAAFRVRNTKREKNLSHTGDELYNYFLAVAFPDNQQQILGYYRTVRDLNGLSPEEFMNKVSENFEISETADPTPKKPRHFTMYLDDKWYSLTAKEGSFPAGDPVLSLDASILHKNLLEPVLNLYDIKTNDRIDFIGGIRGTQELVKRCNENMRVAFALYPTSINQLMNVADSSEVMPAKSTWFEPKLRSGIVTRTL
jgi:uncharacterized protein (DUF1015 family)